MTALPRPSEIRRLRERAVAAEARGDARTAARLRDRADSLEAERWRRRSSGFARSSLWPDDDGGYAPMPVDLGPAVTDDSLRVSLRYARMVAGSCGEHGCRHDEAVCRDAANQAALALHWRRRRRRAPPQPSGEPLTRQEREDLRALDHAGGASVITTMRRNP